ncbi:hypothetical protein D3C71_1733030 [compost metagenome]
MAHDVMVLAEQLLAAEAGQLDKAVVGVSDAALEIGLGNNEAAGERHFNIMDWQVLFHDSDTETARQSWRWITLQATHGITTSWSVPFIRLIWIKAARL